MSSGNWIKWEFAKRRGGRITGFSNKISQKESQRLQYIIPALSYFMSNKKTDVRNLENRLKISRESIDRTLLLLLNKGIIKYEVEGHGRRIYSLISKNAAEKYYHDLRNWYLLKKLDKSKSQKIFKKAHVRLIKSQQDPNSYFDILDNICSFEFKVYEKNEHLQITKDIPWPKPITLDDLPYDKAFEILNNLLIFEKYCLICLNDKMLVRCIQDSKTSNYVCAKGHEMRNEDAESEFDHIDDRDRMIQQRFKLKQAPSIRKGTRRLSDSEIKYQKNYLSKKGKHLF